MVVGHFNSGVSIPASEVYQEAGIIQITPASTNPRFTERNMWNTFRTCGRDDQQGAVGGSYLSDKFKGKKVAVVHDKTPYGKGLADETQKAMNGKGLKEVMYEGINPGEKDYFRARVEAEAGQRGRGLLRRPAHGSRPHHPPDARPGPQRPLMSGDGIVSSEFTSIAGPGAEGTLMTFGPDARRTRTPRTWSRSSARRATSRRPTPSTATRPCRSSPRPPRR
jgi:branched-chain amino acid transport system substrate-binding protein